MLEVLMKRGSAEPDDQNVKSWKVGFSVNRVRHENARDW
jgi:hypothetical protein